jgi:hypothetical protein
MASKYVRKKQHELIEPARCIQFPWGLVVPDEPENYTALIMQIKDGEFKKVCIIVE